LTTTASPNRHPEFPELFCREKKKPGAGEAPETDTTDQTDTDSEKALLCRKCRAAVTSNSYAVAVNGNHHHTFFNPAGIIYEVRCFNRAKGCAVHGQPTDEFSWFKGYVWRFALCATCLDHLGWIFDSGEKSFFGLIASKLIDA